MSKFNNINNANHSSEPEVFARFSVEDVNSFKKRTTLVDVLKSFLYLGLTIGGLKILGDAAIDYNFGDWYTALSTYITIPATIGLAYNCERKIKKYFVDKYYDVKDKIAENNDTLEHTDEEKERKL